MFVYSVNKGHRARKDQVRTSQETSNGHRWTSHPRGAHGGVSLAKRKRKVLTTAKAKEDGSVDPKFRYRQMSSRRMISKRADTNKTRHPELVLCVLGSLLGSC